MKLLLVEDEMELSTALMTILKHHHYSVDTAYNGEEALHLLDCEQYDAVILDIMMPVLDGLSTLKIIRERKNHVPVLMLTAKSEIDDKVLGLDLGADDYLSKPFATKELIARIRAITRRPSERVDNVLTCGNLLLDCFTYELSCANRSVRLSNKEFQMMELLMLNMGILIPTERLFDRIWGLDSDALLNVVWVYISYLRKKMTTLQANVQIKVTRGVGYALVMNDD